MLNVSAVAGFKAQIPCDIDPTSRSEVVSMVFWYKDERDGEPIYSLDARGKSIAQAKLWSDSYVFDERATMRTNVDPAKLEIDPLEATDAGVYRCRVDYKNSPTRNQKVNLTVIGECVLSLFLQCVSCLSLSLSLPLLLFPLDDQSRLIAFIPKLDAISTLSLLISNFLVFQLAFCSFSVIS